VAPRSLWNGTISFGLIRVPVKVFTATESKTVHFQEVHLEDGARIEHRRFCEKEKREVPYEEVVRGFEVKSGEYVVLEKDEAKAAAGGTGHLIEVEHFVPTEDIDPVFFAKTYYLGAQEKAKDGYRVLHDALERTGRAAIGRFTFHNREYVAAIRPLDGVLALHTLRFADELVPGKDIDVATPSRGAGDREVKMAAQLIDTLHEKFKPDRYEDEYRAAVLTVVEAKAKGEAIAADDEPAADDSADLMAALKASLDGAKKGGR
jgi:DNA end-binding protein Ku